MQTDGGSGEYLETANLEMDQDSTDDIRQEYAQAEKPAASEGLSRQGTQNWRSSEISHGSIPSIGSVLDSPYQRSPLPEPHRRQTVKPLEVFPLQVGTNRASISPSLDSIILNPAGPIDPALTNSHTEAPKESNSEGKIEKQGEPSASDAIVEAVKTALAAVNKAQNMMDASQRQATDRNNLPNGKTPNDPNPVVRNAARLHILDDRSGFSSPTLDLNDPEARKNAQALEVLKIISRLGYTFQKDTAHEVKVPEAQAVVATSKSDKKVTCQVCKNFSGRPCELK